MTAPLIASSTELERRAFIASAWECMHNCELCGKCHVLHGRSAEDAFSIYISGEVEYLEAVRLIRQ